jgi:hypothetical protein
VFTVEQRDALRERVLRLAEDDERIVAGAVVGSLAVDGGDRFSDLDLTLGIADHVEVADVLDDWRRTLHDELDAVQLAELERGPTTYRVFLLPDALQLDLSMTSAAQFRPAGPRFRLLFGETAAGESESLTPVAADLFLPTPPFPGDIFGWGVIYALYALYARACIERGRVWQAEHYVGAVRDHASRLPASAKDCPLCRRVAMTTFPLRPLHDSRMPTSARSILGRSGPLSPPPLSRSCARARRRVYRTLMSSRSVSLSFADHIRSSSQEPDPPLRAERPEPLVDQERRPEDGFREDRPDVLPERVGLLPVVEQRAEDPEPVDRSATRGRACAALPHRLPPPSSVPGTRLHIDVGRHEAAGLGR